MSFTFVSHATVNDTIATQVREGLQGGGIQCWVDHYDIGPGDNWNAKIQEALVGCGSGLLLLSRASAKSPECEAEYRFILNDSHKRLFVALVETVPKEEFPFRLGTVQYVDLQTNFPQGLSQLASAIRNAQTRLPTLSSWDFNWDKSPENKPAPPPVSPPQPQPAPFNPIGRWRIQIYDPYNSYLISDFYANGAYQGVQYLGWQQMSGAGMWSFNMMTGLMVVQGYVNGVQPFMLSLQITGAQQNGYTAYGSDGYNYFFQRMA
jgi:hypothetical protein